jgi:hypothetical protein
MFRTFACAAVLALAVQIPAFAASTDSMKGSMKGHAMSAHMKGSMKGSSMKGSSMKGHMKGKAKDSMKGHM